MRNTKIKRITPLAICIALLICLFSGCSGNASNTADTATSPSTAVEAANTNSAAGASADATESLASSDISLPICDEPTTYTMWCGIAPYAASAVKSAQDDQKLYSVIGKLTNIYFDITLVNGAAEEESFNLMIASGDYTDIITGMDYYSSGVSGALEDDIITNIYDYVKESAPNYWNTISKSSECMAKLITNDGEMGTVALLYKEAGLENQGLTIRKDWLDTFGMESPKTYDELYSYLSQAKQNYGAFATFVDDGQYTPFSVGLGVIAGQYMTSDEKVSHFLQVPEYYDYLELIHKWYSEGLINPDFYSVTDMTTNGDLFTSGEASMNCVSAQSMNSLYDKVTSEDVVFCGISNPKTDANADYSCSIESSMLKDYDHWAISTSCDTDKIPDLMKLVNYMYSDAGVLLANYGEEGDTFEYDENGDPKWTEVVTNPTGTSSMVAQTLLVSVNIPSLYDMRKGFYDFDDTAWEALDLFAEQNQGVNCYPSAAEGCLTSEESAEYATYSSDVESYIETTTLQFITGEAALTQEAYDAFVSQAEEMGLNNMVTIYQTAYDRYLEKIASFS